MRHMYWHPMREFAEAERRFSSLFNDVWGREAQPANGHVSWTPAVDVSENAEAFMFTIELPGVKPDAVELEVKDNVLTIKGERARAEEKEGMRVHHRERPTGRFARVFRIGKPVDAERVTATYRDGLLEVVVPLRAEAKARKIPVLEN